MTELWPCQVWKKKSRNFQKIGSAKFFFSYGHWWSPLKVPSITLNKICLIGPSEAAKQVRVKLTPPPCCGGKNTPPCGIGLSDFVSIGCLVFTLFLVWESHPPVIRFLQFLWTNLDIFLVYSTLRNTVRIYLKGSYHQILVSR